jgi:hypothetical protein
LHSCQRLVEGPQKLKIELPYDLLIPLLSIYPKELKSEFQMDVCTSTFVSVLFMTANM